MNRQATSAGRWPGALAVAGFLLAAAFAVLYVRARQAKPVEIVKEVPREIVRVITNEVPREVVKVVTNEVVKEVPREIVKTVERQVIVTNVVPAKLSEAEALYLETGSNWVRAAQAEATDQPFYRLTGVSFDESSVFLDESAAKALTKKSVADRAAQVLRQNELKFDDPKSPTLFIAIEGIWDNDVLVYTLRVSLLDKVVLYRQGEQRARAAEVWSTGSVGRIGRAEASDWILNSVGANVGKFVREFQEQRQKETKAP